MLSSKKEYLIFMGYLVWKSLLFFMYVAFFSFLRQDFIYKPETVQNNHIDPNLSNTYFFVWTWWSPSALMIVNI